MYCIVIRSITIFYYQIDLKLNYNCRCHHRDNLKGKTWRMLTLNCALHANNLCNNVLFLLHTHRLKQIKFRLKSHLKLTVSINVIFLSYSIFDRKFICIRFTLRYWIIKLCLRVIIHTTTESLRRISGHICYF